LSLIFKCRRLMKPASLLGVAIWVSGRLDVVPVATCRANPDHVLNLAPRPTRMCKIAFVLYN